MTRVGVAVLGAALAVGSLAGCGGDGGGDGLSSSSGGGSGGGDVTLPEDVVAVGTDPAEVTALDNTFDDQGIRIAPGTTVRWTNRGHQDHDVVPAEGEGWGVDIGDFAPGDVYEHTFDQPGTYSYYCTIHGTPSRGMVGAVVVE